MPTGSADRRYTPSVSLASVRVNPVDALLAVTVAPGTAAPCWSRTRPVMVPVVCCASAVAQVSRTSVTAPRNLLIIQLLQMCEQQLTCFRSRPESPFGGGCAGRNWASVGKSEIGNVAVDVHPDG